MTHASNSLWSRYLSCSSRSAEIIAVAKQSKGEENARAWDAWKLSRLDERAAFESFLLSKKEEEDGS